jgi:hypothetical protein
MSHVIALSKQLRLWAFQIKLFEVGVKKGISKCYKSREFQRVTLDLGLLARKRNAFEKELDRFNSNSLIE